MVNSKSRLTYLFLILLFFKTNESFAIWLPNVPQKIKLCARCHTQDGNSLQPLYPKLAGQFETYLFKQLIDFKLKRRNNPLMQTITKNLSEKELQELAMYFSRQSSNQGYAQPINLTLGKKLYKAGDHKKGIPACSACHGAAGEGNKSAKIPRLAGQHREYIIKQLQSFQEGKRINDSKTMMRTITQALSPEEIVAVANYISGLYK